VKLHDRSQLLTPGEVALMFRVDPKTVTRWASSGRIGSVRTPGGHRRFLEADIKFLLDKLTTEAGRPTAAAENNQPFAPVLHSVSE
jgi:excisionase family DNA binding protein